MLTYKEYHNPFCGGRLHTRFRPISIPLASAARRFTRNGIPAPYNPYRMQYVEVAPSGRLTAHVECFWSLSCVAAPMHHRVLPDGCTDLVFTISGGRIRGTAVGAMTRCLITPLAPGDEVFGMRFHPAMSHGLLGAPVASLTDVAADLDALWGKHGRILAQRLGERASLQERAALIGAALNPAETLTPLQRAAICIVRAGGSVSPDDLASRAGLSARQLRRLCVDQAGIGIKTLCRIVRFRRAAIDIANPPRSWADFALDHGYYDQAHFINEFKEFSGLTPSAYACSFSPPNPHDAAKS